MSSIDIQKKNWLLFLSSVQPSQYLHGSTTVFHCPRVHQFKSIKVNFWIAMIHFLDGHA
jgi:hypothetical protein